MKAFEFRFGRGPIPVYNSVDGCVQRHCRRGDRCDTAPVNKRILPSIRGMRELSSRGSTVRRGRPRFLRVRDRTI